MPVYDKKVQDAIKKVKKPFNIRVHIVAYPTNTLAVRVYESDISEYNESQRMQIMEYLYLVQGVIESFGFDSFLDGISDA